MFPIYSRVSIVSSDPFRPDPFRPFESSEFRSLTTFATFCHAISVGQEGGRENIFFA